MPPNNLDLKTNSRLEEDGARLFDELMHAGETYLRNAIKNANLVFTGDLLDSVKAQMHNDFGFFGSEIVVHFNRYWRYKDMKYYDYSKNNSYINVDAIRAWVKTVGVGNFAWVAGYEGKPPGLSEEKAIDRIVRAIVFHRRKIPRVKNISQKRVYNRTKVAYMNLVRRRISELVGKSTLRAVANELMS